MGNIRDKWTQPGANNRRVHSPRWGKGKRWLAQWQDGPPPHSAAFDTKVEAETHLAQRATGTLPTAQGLTSGGITLGEMVTAWKATHLNMRDSSRNTAHSRLNSLSPEWLATPISEVTNEMVQALVAEWTFNDGLKESTIKAKFTQFKSVFALAVRRSDTTGLTKNPCNDVNLKKVPKRKVVPLTQAQVDQIITQVNDRFRSMAIVAAATGLRITELRGLSWDRVNGRIITVDRQIDDSKRGAARALAFGPPKTEASERDVDMGEVAHAALLAHRLAYPGEDGDLIWRNADGSQLDPWQATDVWTKAHEGVRPAKPWQGWHDLRHFNASMLINAGLSVIAVKDRLGHDKASVTLDVYGHLWPNDQSKAVAAIDAALGHIQAA